MCVCVCVCVDIVGIAPKRRLVALVVSYGLRVAPLANEIIVGVDIEDGVARHELAVLGEYSKRESNSNVTIPCVP